MLQSTGAVGLRLSLSYPCGLAVKSIPTLRAVSSRRTFAGHASIRSTIWNLNRPPPSTSSPPSTTPSSSSSSSSFFTPSLCRTTRRQASTVSRGATTPAQPLDWNSFFRLRTSRRRYGLTSSILSAVLTTGAMFVFLSTQPELADQMTKMIPTDPFISLGVATFGATAVGWLLGPIFGNSLWRLLHRARLSDFTIKEKAFFERIKRHRVNPSGASTNNPVPDFYGEKIGSVSGYRRWLKDQRAFNRKRDGIYSSA